MLFGLRLVSTSPRDKPTSFRSRRRMQYEASLFVRRRYTAPFKFNTAGLCTEGKKGGRKAGEQATSKPLCRDAALTHSLAHLPSLFFFPAAAMMITNLRRTDGRTERPKRQERWEEERLSRPRDSIIEGRESASPLHRPSRLRTMAADFGCRKAVRSERG